MSAAAERHRRLAEGFTSVAEQTSDWSAPAPVAGWTARDVVAHLVTWSTGFLAAGGIDLPPAVDLQSHPAAAWRRHVTAVQALLDAPQAAEPFTHPYVGTAPLGDTIDRFYITDVLMHTWDLAQAARVPSGLDPAECADLLAGMRPIEAMLRESGQYGPAVAVPADAGPVVELMGFIGRDPRWRVVSAG